MIQQDEDKQTNNNITQIKETNNGEIKSETLLTFDLITKSEKIINRKRCLTELKV